MDMIRRLFLLSLTCLFLLAPHAGCAAQEYAYTLAIPGPDDLPAGDAAGIALCHVLEEGSCITLSEDGTTYDFPRIELTSRPIYCKTTYVRNQQQGGWVVSFFPEDIPMLAAAVDIASPSGEVIGATFGFTVTMLSKWEAEKGNYAFWSLEDKVLFDTLYANPAQNEFHVLPTDADISLEAALQIAQGAIAAAYNASPGSDVLPAYNLIQQQDGSRQWQIDFFKKGHADGTPDLLYWVYVDAATGEVLVIDENAGGLG